LLLAFHDNFPRRVRFLVQHWTLKTKSVPASV
jgi:hypothetical protein